MFLWTKLCERFAALGRFTPWELCIFVLWQVLKWKTWVFFFTKSKDQCRWKPCKMFSVSGSLLSQAFHITYKGGIALPGPNKASSALGWLKQKDEKKKILRSRPGPCTSLDPLWSSWRWQWYLPFSMWTFDHHNLLKILESALQWHWQLPQHLSLSTHGLGYSQFKCSQTWPSSTVGEYFLLHIFLLLWEPQDFWRPVFSAFSMFFVTTSPALFLPPWAASQALFSSTSLEFMKVPKGTI